MSREHHMEMWRAGKPSLDLSDCGTGKSRSTLDFLVDLKLELKKDMPKVFVFAPSVVLDSAWNDDIGKWAPGMLTTKLCFATKRKESLMSDVDVYLVNHDGINWIANNLDLIRDKVEGAILVIDEFTAYKNRDAMRTKNMIYVSQFARMVIELSGTPKTKTITETWAPLFIADRGERLGNNFYRYQAQMCVGEPNYAAMANGARNATIWSDKEGAVDMFYDMVRDIAIRHEESKCQDLPKNRKRVMKVELPKKAMDAYKAFDLSKMAINEDGTLVSITNQGALLQKKLQLCTGAVYDESGEVVSFHQERYELVIHLCKEAGAAIVAFNWRHERDALFKLALKEGLKVGYLDGTVADYMKGEMVRMFQRGDFDIMLCHPASVAHGVTFTRAKRTIWASLTRRTENFIQFNKRVHRGGVEHETDTIFIASKGTKEEEAYEALMNEEADLQYLLKLFAEDTDNRQKAEKKA